MITVSCGDLAFAITDLEIEDGLAEQLASERARELVRKVICSVRPCGLSHSQSSSIYSHDDGIGR